VHAQKIPKINKYILKIVDFYKHVKLYTRALLTWLFQLVGDDTTDEVRLGAPQSGHQVVQLLLWFGEITHMFHLAIYFLSSILIIIVLSDVRI
jgi:hypothetical protein